MPVTCLIAPFEQAICLFLVSFVPAAVHQNLPVSGKPDTKAASSDYVLVPFVDSMNHVTSAKTELSFSPVSGDLGVSVNRCDLNQSAASISVPVGRRGGAGGG